MVSQTQNAAAALLRGENKPSQALPQNTNIVHTNQTSVEAVSQRYRELKQLSFWRQAYSARHGDIAPWYGSFAELKPVLHSVASLEGAVKPKRVLQFGFGAADTSEKVYEEFKLEALSILTTSDFSSQETRCQNKRLNVRFLKVDASQSIPSEPEGNKFDWIIDRGILDLRSVGCNSVEPHSAASIKEYLEGLLNLITPQGRVICITLGHDPVLKHLVTLSIASDWSVRVVPFATKEEELHQHCFEPVAFIIAPKREESVEKGKVILDTTILSRQYNPARVDRPAPASIYQLFKIIKDIRRFTFRETNLIDYKPGNLNTLDMVSQTSGEVDYVVTVYDRIYPKFSSRDEMKAFYARIRPTIAILVPQAEQHQWLYKTPTGHQKLCEKAGCRRVICVFLPCFGPLAENQRDPQEVVTSIQKDLGTSLITLAVDSSTPVLLMTQQENFKDERIMLYKGESELSGKIFVFDAPVDEDDEELRETEDDHEPSPISVMNQNETQTKSKATKWQRRTMVFRANPRMAQTEVWHYKKDKNIEFEYLHVCHAYHILLLGAMTQLPAFGDSCRRMSGVILGLGGGELSMLLAELLKERLELECVELDPQVADIAREHFGFKCPPEKLHIDDAVHWVLANSKELAGQRDFVIIDINGTEPDLEGISCPPKSFCTTEFLDSAKLLLKPDGALYINAVLQSERALHKFVEILKPHFPHVAYLKYSQDANHIVICGSSPVKPAELCDPRIALLDKVPAIPSIHRLIARTPMYLGQHSVFRVTAQAL